MDSLINGFKDYFLNEIITGILNNLNDNFKSNFFQNNNILLEILINWKFKI
jgi:hypothetical protein